MQMNRPAMNFKDNTQAVKKLIFGAIEIGNPNILFLMD